MLLTQIDLLISRIKDAGYAHLLLEPLPLFGLFFGLIFFALGLWGKQDKTRLLALLIIAGSCASVIPYAKYRDQAQPRIVELMPLKKSIKDQTELRKDSHWVYFTVGGIAIFALIGGGKLANLANYSLLITGLGALVFSLWLHMKEAEIFHPQIRGAPSRAVPQRSVPAAPGPVPLPAPSPKPIPAQPIKPASPPSPAPETAAPTTTDRPQGYVPFASPAAAPR
jgi:hypothetical protein